MRSIGLMLFLVIDFGWFSTTRSLTQLLQIVSVVSLDLRIAISLELAIIISSTTGAFDIMPYKSTCMRMMCAENRRGPVVEQMLHESNEDDSADKIAEDSCGLIVPKSTNIGMGAIHQAQRAEEHCSKINTRTAIRRYGHGLTICDAVLK